MTAYLTTTTQDPFSNLINSKGPIQDTFNVRNSSPHSQNDEHLLAKDTVIKKNSAPRCAVGLILYALGLFLFAYGQLVQPSLLLMLAGSAVLIFSCYTFMPEVKLRAADGSEDYDSKNDEDVSN